MGVEVRTGAKVTEATAEGLKLADRSFIASELIVWAAGVKAPPVLRDLDGLEVNRINQLVVTQALQTTRDPNIFAMGDCAACPRPASAARCHRGRRPHTRRRHTWCGRSSAGCAARRCSRIHTGTSARWFHSGDGPRSGNLMGFVRGRSLFIEGFFARMMYGSLRLMHERALHGTRKHPDPASSRARWRGEPGRA